MKSCLEFRVYHEDEERIPVVEAIIENKRITSVRLVNTGPCVWSLPSLTTTFEQLVEWLRMTDNQVRIPGAAWRKIGTDWELENLLKQAKLEVPFEKGKKKFQPTIAIDFDGVIHAYRQKWTTEAEILDGPSPGAKDAINEYLCADIHVVIYSTRARSQEGRDAMRAWLEKYGFPPIPIALEKPAAQLYIDDRGFRFVGRWPTAYEAKHWRPWNRRRNCDLPTTQEAAIRLRERLAGDSRKDIPKEEVLLTLSQVLERSIG